MIEYNQCLQSANETQSGGAIRDILQGKKPDSCRKVSAFLEERMLERKAEYYCREERREGYQQSMSSIQPFLKVKEERVKFPGEPATVSEALTLRVISSALPHPPESESQSSTALFLKIGVASVPHNDPSSHLQCIL